MNTTTNYDNRLMARELRDLASSVWAAGYGLPQLPFRLTGVLTDDTFKKLEQIRKNAREAILAYETALKAVADELHTN